MVSRNELKLVRQLEQKKYRRLHGLFVAEGDKVCDDLLRTMPVYRLYSSSGRSDAIAVTDDELRRMSFLQHPQGTLGIFRMPQHSSDEEKQAIASCATRLCLALDGVQDPGNMGTILRIADWFGIDTVFCSESTADVWNPKVVQATMGSIARVKVWYTDLTALIQSLPPSTPVYGTLLDGDDIYSATLHNRGLLVMGNEGNGISPEVRSMVTHRLLIPPYPADRRGAESLNVSVATALVCGEIRRRADNII